MKRIRRSRNLVVESLESRQLLSGDGLQGGVDVFDPSALEQEMLEHLNRMRIAPQAELDILFTDASQAIARDPDARLAVTLYEDPSPQEIEADWSKLSSVQPLAWNTSLYDAAYAHTSLMVQYDSQSHLLPGELSLAQRLVAAGYEGSAVGENVFAYMNNVFHGHSAFAIDWGVPNRSHRDNMMASTFREVGISIVGDDNEGSQVGPLLVTQDYGDGRNLENPCLLGVVWDDTNDNGWYDAGEGFSDVEFLIEGTGGTFTTTSMTAGGYQTLIPAGSYTITAYGGQLPTPMVVRDVSISNANVKVDFEYDPYQSQAPLVDLNGPAETGVDYQTTFYEGSPAIPVVAVDATVTDDDDEQIVSLTATITNMFDPGEYLSVDTTGTSIAADYDANSGVLTLSGAAAVGEYQQVLATLSYGNLAVGPDETPRVIEVEASDGTYLGPTAVATVGVVRTTLPDLVIDDVQAEEHNDGSTTYQFTVSMSDTMIRTVTVDFATEDDSATAGSDYEAVTETLQFAPGQTVQTVSITLIDDEVREGTETFFGKLSNAVGATITKGVGTCTIADDDPLTRLGGVDFLGIRGLDLASMSAIYELTTTHEGVLSVEASGDSESEITLTLYDQDWSPEAVLVLVSTGGIARFDLPNVAVGQTYILEVTGTAADADLLLGNVVQQNGKTVSVVGTSEDDVLQFTAGDSLQFEFNGLSYSYSWEDADTLAFSGGEGDDQASLTGGAGDDSAKLLPLRGYLSGNGYLVSLAETEAIQIAGGGGSNTAQLYDSPGDETFYADGNGSSMTGEGFANSVSQFATILGYATAGGEDSAQLVGTENYDEFIGKPDVSKVVSDGLYLRAKMFDHVSAVGNGGDWDFARIYGDKGVEHFVGRPNSGEMVGEGFHYQVDDFYSVHGYSRGRNSDDTAVLIDSPGDDTVVMNYEFAKIFGDEFYTRAKYFPSVEVDGTGEGFDWARLKDSKGDDVVVIDVVESSIEGPGYSRQVHGFDEVTAYSREGGNDTATFYDTPGDDTFVARPGDARLEGDGFVGQAFRYGTVHAYANAGGTNTATLFDSAEVDDFYSDPSTSVISGTGYYAGADFFDSVQAYSSAGGRDTARFSAGDSDSVFVGNPAFSTMEEADTFRRAEAFAAVYAEAGTGIDTAIFQGSGRDDDLFESGDDWSRLTNDPLGILIEARQFETVTDPSEEGGSGE